MRRILAEVTDCPIPLLAQLLRSSQMCVTRWFSPSACWQSVIDEAFGKGTIPTLHAAAVALHTGYHFQGVTNTPQVSAVRARSVLPEHVQAVVVELPDLACSFQRKTEELGRASAIASSPILHELVNTAGRLPSWEQSTTRVLHLLGMDLSGNSQGFEGTLQDIKSLLTSAYEPVFARLQKKLVSELSEAWAAPSAHDLVMVAANASASTQRVPVSTLSKAVWQTCHDASSPTSALDSCNLACQALGQFRGVSDDCHSEDPHEPSQSRSTLDACAMDCTAADRVPAGDLIQTWESVAPAQPLQRTTSVGTKGTDAASGSSAATGSALLQHGEISLTVSLPACLTSKRLEEDGIEQARLTRSGSAALPVLKPEGGGGKAQLGRPPSKLPATAQHACNLEGLLPFQLTCMPASSPASASVGALCKGSPGEAYESSPSLELAAAPAASKESESVPSPCARVGGCKRSMDSPHASSMDEPAKRRRPLRPRSRCQRSAELLLQVCVELGASSVPTASPITLPLSSSLEG